VHNHRGEWQPSIGRFRRGVNDDVSTGVLWPRFRPIVAIPRVWHCTSRPTLNRTFPPNVRSHGLVIGARTIAHHVEGDESYAGEIVMSRGCQAHYTPP
jgi:hypothetical protein